MGVRLDKTAENLSHNGGPEIEDDSRGLSSFNNFSACCWTEFSEDGVRYHDLSGRRFRDCEGVTSSRAEGSDAMAAAAISRSDQHPPCRLV